MSGDRGIHIEQLTKTFRVKEHGRGLRGAARGLFRPTYKQVVAVDGLNLSIAAGERVAFVGPNGAGKSTTLKMLTGILTPDSGEARVLGQVPWRDRKTLGYRIGTVFGQRSQLWYHLPARDAFELLASIYEIEKRRFRDRLDELVAAFSIEDLLSRPVRQLSLGQRMRCEIAASLLHRPEVLFLDEPTIGLDVTAKNVIRDLVRKASVQDGCTVLLTSHDTGDMERVCERVVVINDGKLILDRPVRELRSAYIQRKMVTLMTAEEFVDLDLPGVTVVEREPYRTRLEVDTACTPIDQVVSRALECCRLRDLTVEDPPMEEIVELIYRQGSGLDPS